MSCDGCSADCSRVDNVCGDGIAECGEECDDGNDSNFDECLNDCRLARCGDGYLHWGVEACDDGNNASCDGCSADCSRVDDVCGDGIVECGEECDDGNQTSGDGCSSDCRLEGPLCGNGVLDPGEECDLGPANETRYGLAVWQPGGVYLEAAPVARWTDSRSFYAYVSASAHTGYEAVGRSLVFLYRDMTSGVLSLVIVHGIDRDTTGQVQNTAELEMHLSGLPPGTTLGLSDDRNEFVQTSPTEYHGDWWFRYNTDGGLVDGLTYPGTWLVTIEPFWQYGLDEWVWVDDHNLVHELDMSQPLYIEASVLPVSCRQDCTIPKCGDGILDPGEECDDGNVSNGDGCDASCALETGP